jgi:hypothetical protein
MYPFQMSEPYMDHPVLEIPSHPNSKYQYRAEIPVCDHLKSKGIGSTKRVLSLHE